MVLLILCICRFKVFQIKYLRTYVFIKWFWNIYVIKGMYYVHVCTFISLYCPALFNKNWAGIFLGQNNVQSGPDFVSIVKNTSLKTSDRQSCVLLCLYTLFLMWMLQARWNHILCGLNSQNGKLSHADCLISASTYPVVVLKGFPSSSSLCCSNHL